MDTLEETYETEIQFVRKLFYRDIVVILISTIIAIIGYVLHSIGVFGFFISITGISLMFMMLIGFERYEIHNKYNGNDNNKTG